MNYKIITTDELVGGINLETYEYNYLMDLLQLDDDDFDVLSIFEGDPDFIKVDSENVPFIVVKVKGVSIYILLSPEYIYYDYYKAVNILKWWINGAKNDLVGAGLDNNWNDWGKVDKGVAYRGGSGYYYALYAKETL